MQKKNFAIALALVASLGLGACDDDASTTGTQAGSMSLLLTDAPGDFVQAIVTIERIELLRDDDSDENQGGVLVLRDTEYTGDLLDLSNDVAELVNDFTVPGGSYQQLRFVISGGCVEVETDTGTEVYASNGYTECGAADGDLQMPSFAQSGLKVNLPGGFTVNGGQKIVLVDFDVAQSFGHQAGNSGKWVMHPVMTATEIEFSSTLDVRLIVPDSVTFPSPYTLDSLTVRLNDEEPVTLADSVANFLYVVPGTYSVDLVVPSGLTITTDPALPLDVDLGSDTTEQVEITITSAN